MEQLEVRIGPGVKLRTLWVPAHKVQGTNTGSGALSFSLAFSLGGARASCHLRHSLSSTLVPGRPGAKDRAVGGGATCRKHNKKLMNAGELKAERQEMFKKHLELGEKYKHVNQWV